ncbi:aspartate/glutamate racemase family protein [Aquibacillus sp. 3ASR75-11]|uniref:Aspartate/glutamate racemase family protein n=1 Tax=Terrihalobacillus insolitus TaxID=2950438 RepID=A0A9X3WRX0_9BACI|nr:aspartate/glutamate racemase family protein [Terrihalobacillus insolitus]MDC3423156.1 aspartate/glutamate racemase family protein [Terrihalobacillus insolitus]
MKVLGLIGGMSWESSSEYYRKLNQAIAQKLGGLHSAECILYSIDFNEIDLLQRQGEWEKAGQKIATIAKKLENAGAELLLLCTNTMHKVADTIERDLSIPLVHIGDATAKEITSAGISKVGLLGTTYTMEEDFYHDRLNKHGVKVITPNNENRSELNRIIFDELCKGIFVDDSKEKIIKMLQSLKEQGAEGIVLGCTEIPLIIKDEDSPLPIFNTLEIHVQTAVNLALS